MTLNVKVQEPSRLKERPHYTLSL